MNCTWLGWRLQESRAWYNGNMGKRWVRWLVLILSIGVTVRLGGNVWRLIRAGERGKRAQSEVAAAEVENKQLQQKLEEVKSDDFVEREAREKLGLGKLGEVVVIVPSPPNLKSQATNSNTEANWRKWWELYVGI